MNISVSRGLACTLLLVLLVMVATRPVLAGSPQSLKIVPPRPATLQSAQVPVSRMPEGSLPVVVNSMATGLSADWHIAAASNEADQSFHYRASNSRQRLEYAFTDRGLQIRPAGTTGDPDWSLQFALRAYGYEGSTRAMTPAAEPRVTDTRIEYHYPDSALTEWYVSSPVGLEHGYTVQAPPAGQQHKDHLVFELTLADNLAATVTADRRAVVFSTAGDEPVLSYGGLYATDATGRRLPADLRLDGERLLLRVAAADASYPLTIDPLFQAEQKFTPPSPGSGDHYGNAVAIDGDWMVIGAPGKDDTVADAGVVYLYQRQGDDTWSFYQRLSGNDFSASGYHSQSGAEFGDAVAIDGGVLVIGAPGHNGVIDPLADAGRAFVYNLNMSCSVDCWTPLQVLDAGSYQNIGDRFGDAVDIDVNTIVVGAPLDEGGGALSDRGAAYVYQGSGSTLSLVARVASNTTNPVLGSNDQFGSSVALRGGALVVGAPGDDEYAADAGAVYLYDVSLGWSLYQKILGQAVTEWFGRDVDIDPFSFRMVASAHRALANGVTYGGVVRIYTGAWFVGWLQTGTLTPSGTDNTTPDSAYYGYFGNSVAFEKASNGNEYILVGAVRNKSSPADSCSPVCGGAAYVFEDSGSGPVQIRKLSASDAGSAEYYGEVAALDHMTAVVGAPRQVQGVESGAAYVYSMVSTWLDVELDSHAIKTTDQLSVKATLHVGGVPAPNAVLNSRPVALRITPPNGQSYVVNGSTSASGGSGVVDFPLQGPFSTPGSYTFEVTFPGTTTWSAAAAPPETVLVSDHAGYLVIIEGAATPGGDADELTHYKFVNHLYQTALLRGFTPENIFFLAQDDPQYPYPGYPYYRPDIDLDLGQHDYPYLASYLLETDTGNGNESLVEKLRQSPGPVHIVLVDHGDIDPATETGRFYLNAQPDYMTPADLNSLLTGIEAVPGMLDWPRTVTVLSCYSGSFIDALANPPVPGRVILTSARTNEEAFKGMPDQSTAYPYGVREGSYFGGELLEELARGASFREGFMLAEDRTEVYTRADDSFLAEDTQYRDNARQHPLLEDNPANGNAGSNKLSEVAGLDGWVAKDVYFGVGAEYNLYPFTTSPTIYLSSPQVYCLTLTPESLIPPYWFTYISAAGMALRAPGIGMALPAPSGVSGQLDTPYTSFNGSQVVVPNPPYGSYETYQFCTNFDTAGKWEAWLYGEDSQGKQTETRRVVVYVNGAGNSPPDDINLISPPNNTETGTNPSFDWDRVDDPDNKAVTYRLQIASASDVDGSGIFLSQNVVHTIDHLRGSRAHVDVRAGLQDLETYYWQVLAVDADGGWKVSPVWSFDTNNKNLIGTRLVGRATANSVALEGALIQIAPGADLSDEYGEYIIDDLFIGAAQSATASLSGFAGDAAAVDLYAFHDTPWNPDLAQACSPTLNPASHTGIGEAGSQNNTVAVGNAAGCSWTAASNSPGWITVSSGDSLHVYSGNHTVTYNVSRNTTTTPRNGTITIAGQTFAVAQNAALDTDGDGTSDWLDTDDDNDGLTDTQETGQYGTDPLLWDSDYDGASDYFEVNAGTDPRDPGDTPVWGDIDGDGFVDLTDVLLATRASLEMFTPDPYQLFRGNVAPLVNGIPAPDPNDHKIDLADLLLIQRKAYNQGLY